MTGASVEPSAKCSGGERLPRSARICRSREIESIFRQGKRIRMPFVDVLALVFVPPRATVRAPRNREQTRFCGRVGVVVPKLGQGIVARNRLKRRLREIARRRVLRRLQEAGVDADVLIWSKRSAYRATYPQLEDMVTTGMEAICFKGR